MQSPLGGQGQGPVASIRADGQGGDPAPLPPLAGKKRDQHPVPWKGRMFSVKAVTTSSALK